jgi:hypothetical protein
VAINDPNGNGEATEARPPGVDAPPHAQDGEPSGPGAPDPGRGGCLKLGWGCLPVLAVAALFPAGLLF